MPNTIEWGETSINKWRIGFNVLQLNGAKWRKKRLGENRKDWILGAPVCPSLRFSGWILNEESSLSLSPWHRGWSHSWHSGVLTEVALWGVYSCRSTGRGHLYYCCFPARRYLPPPNSHPMLGLGLILQKFPDLKETAERLIQSLPFMYEERSVDTLSKSLQDSRVWDPVSWSGKKLMGIQYTKQHKCYYVCVSTECSEHSQAACLIFLSYHSKPEEAWW